MKVTTDAIVETIEIAAPPERVFRALTTPEELLAWWGSPETYRCESWHLDLRVGGHWQCSGTNASGRAFGVAGEYLEIDAPRRLAYTWQPSWVEARQTTVRIELERTPAGTRLTWTHSGFAAFPRALEDHRQGLPSVVGWLKQHAEAQP